MLSGRRLVYLSCLIVYWCICGDLWKFAVSVGSFTILVSVVVSVEGYYISSKW